MHVPYSMDDSEPDLYAGLGFDSPQPNDDWYFEPDPTIAKSCQHNFYTQNQIDKLKSELDDVLGLLSYIYNHTENLPSGVSKQIREQLTKDRL